jgi:Small-conductance mechanosensitive channel
LKPFKVNDLIEAQGFMGVVKEIQIFSTILQTADNKIIYIPNGGLSTASMTNYSTQPDRRVDLTFNIAYGQQVEVARDILMQIIRVDNRILNLPAEPFIAVSEITDSTVKLVVRVWTKSENYWGVYFDMNEKVYNTFLSEGLTSRPVPQMNVTLNK